MRDGEGSGQPRPRGARSPSEAEVRVAVDRVLASRCFEQATRSSRFLRFVVEQTLTGQGERLKGYTIAIEVFGRPPDFDAQSDPLVRVEAGRLRRRLIEYYAGEGKNDPLRIDLPRGAYSIAAAYAAPALAEPPTEPESSARAASAQPVPSPRRHWRRVRALLVASVILAALGVVVLQQIRGSRAPRGAEPSRAETLVAGGRPPIVVLPFEDLSAQNGLRSLANTLTEEVLLLLDAPDLFVVATELRPGGVARGEGPVAVPATIHAAYVLSGSVREADEGVRVTARLVLAATGTQIWSGSFDEPVRFQTSRTDQQRVAREIAAVANPYGPIFEVELERIRQLGPSALATRDCVLKYYDYRRGLDPGLHGSTLACFERAVAAERGSATAWGGYALMLLDRFAYGYGATPTDERAFFEQARESARTAMDIDGDNLLANLGMARVQYFGGEDFERTAERVLALRRNNAEALSLVGAMHVLGGDLGRGLEMVERAIALTPKAPGGYYATQALGLLRAERHEEAVAAALRIDSPNWPMGHLIVTATAALAGRSDVAERARDRLLAVHPQIEAELSAVLDRWRIVPELRVALRRGLEVAGLAPR